MGYGLSYDRPRFLGPVNTDPRVSLAQDRAASTFLLRGKAPAPWHFTLDGAISARPVDLGAQEDARQFTWTSASTLGIEGPAVSLTKAAKDGMDLLIDWRIDRAPSGPVTLGLGGGKIDFARLISAAPIGKAIETRVPLRCFAAAGAKLDAVGGPVRIEAPAGFAATLRTITLVRGGPSTSC
jgi:beta-glucosidase